MSEQGVLRGAQANAETGAAFSILAIMVLSVVVIALLWIGEYLYALILVAVILVLVFTVWVALRSAKIYARAAERAAAAHG